MFIVISATRESIGSYHASVAATCLSDCISSFNLLNETTPACPGLNLVLECSTKRGGSTVFHGNLLNCHNTNNEIALLHSRFNTSTGINATCNNGTILGYSLPANASSNCYTSQLHITITPSMVGKKIQCVYDNGVTTDVIGNFSIEGTQCYTMTVTIVTPTSTTGKLLFMWDYT